MIELSVILPVHNQETIIEPVYQEIFKTLKKMHVSFEVFLVENGSEDNTLSTLRKIATQFPKTKILTSKKGYGSAIRKGMKSMKGKHVLYMPSDGQVDAALLPILWRQMQTKKFDMIKIRRTSRETAARAFLSRALTYTLAFSFGTKKIDVNGSPRIFESKHLSTLNLSASDSFIDAELLIKASHLRWKIKEVAMRHIERAGGVSSRNYKTYIEFLRNIIYYRFSAKLPEWKNELHKKRAFTS